MATYKEMRAAAVECLENGVDEHDSWRIYLNEYPLTIDNHAEVVEPFIDVQLELADA